MLALDGRWYNLKWNCGDGFGAILKMKQKGIRIKKIELRHKEEFRSHEY